MAVRGTADFGTSLHWLHFTAVEVPLSFDLDQHSLFYVKPVIRAARLHEC